MGTRYQHKACCAYLCSLFRWMLTFLSLDQLFCTGWISCYFFFQSMQTQLCLFLFAFRAFVCSLAIVLFLLALPQLILVAFSKLASFNLENLSVPDHKEADDKRHLFPLTQQSGCQKHLPQHVLQPQREAQDNGLQFWLKGSLLAQLERHDVFSPSLSQ